MTSSIIASRKSDAVGIIREDHPFDRGYWARFDGLPRPSAPDEAKGWDACDQDIEFEESSRREPQVN